MIEIQKRRSCQCYTGTVDIREARQIELLKGSVCFPKHVREPMFGLSILGYCRNMVVQHGGLHERRPTPYVDIKVHSKVIKHNSYLQVFIHSLKHTYEYYVPLLLDTTAPDLFKNTFQNVAMCFIKVAM